MPTAVVTGAASGIGEATARLLARTGFRVACVDVDATSSSRVASDIGNNSVAFPLDVSSEADVTAVFGAIGRDFGQLDALATCAGIMDAAEFMALDSEKFRRILEVNVLGTFLCLREAAKLMARGSRICTVASISALRGAGFVGVAPAYTASKGAVLALTKAAARSFAEIGISVNTVSPGPTLSPMLGAREDGTIDNLVRRFGKPSEIAEAIVFLLSPSASYISGSNLVADGGLALY